ncbi:tetratricopeptide repeat protein [Flavobacterium oreochromis]|uniref:tetratricopeptide repeat protein n=1 Tax=Flavobacterium oreochromis TaxID=2906078 RepID=UPI00385F2CDA
MATYNKRGYKAPKPQVEKTEEDTLENVPDLEQTIAVEESESTTANVFNTLDETASKTEEFVAKNQNLILSVLGGVALVVVGYLMYNKFVSTPSENEAASDMYQAQKYFQQAVDASQANDSLFKLALNGGEGKQGFIDIAKNHSGTDAGNLANYYAGMAYLHTKQFEKAIEYLNDYKSDDAYTNALALGAIGDAKAELNKTDEALEYYVKAAESNANELTTPRFLLKAGQLAFAKGDKANALKYFTEIKEKYEDTPEAQNIDALMGMAQ